MLYLVSPFAYIQASAWSNSLDHTDISISIVGATTSPVLLSRVVHVFTSPLNTEPLIYASAKLKLLPVFCSWTIGVSADPLVT